MFTRRDTTTTARSPLADIKPLDRASEPSQTPLPAVEPRTFQTVEPASKLAQADKQMQSHAGHGPVQHDPVQHSPVQHGMASFAAGSIIGNDLTIMGQGLRIVTRGTLQVDGRIEGDVVGQEVIIGERGHVTGVVCGETVIVRGTVHGSIKAIKVLLQSGARVDGDVHHQQLSVEQGAHLDGRVRRPQDLADLKPDLTAAAAKLS